ncbi:hypothetical protein [Streptosporangium sandarakinum]
MTYSFARAWFATRPARFERRIRERYRFEVLRYGWPRMTTVKTAYHRRRRGRRA